MNISLHKKFSDSNSKVILLHEIYMFWESTNLVDNLFFSGGGGGGYKDLDELLQCCEGLTYVKLLLRDVLGSISHH